LFAIAFKFKLLPLNIGDPAIVLTYVAASSPDFPSFFLYFGFTSYFAGA